MKQYTIYGRTCDEWFVMTNEFDTLGRIILTADGTYRAENAQGQSFPVKFKTLNQAGKAIAQYASWK